MNASETALERHRWTIAEYRHMAETGTLSSDARVELIDGEIIDMAPIGPAHAGIVDQLTQLLLQAVAGTAIVRVQNPIELSDDSEPEPDLTLLRPRADFYKRRLPGAEDVLLAIEVADSTLVRDRDVKRALYARHGIPEYWIVDIRDEQILTFRDPVGDIYGCESTMDDIRAVQIYALADVRIDLSGLFES